MPAKSDALLHELFWRSSLRKAVLDVTGGLVLTSKAFRDAFTDIITFSGEGIETLDLKEDDADPTLIERLSSLPPGEHFSHTIEISFAGTRTGVRVEVTALQSTGDHEQLFLTEWNPVIDDDSCSRALDDIEQKYRSLQENLPVGVYRADEEGLLQTANSALIRMMGFQSFEELQNARLKEVWVDPEQRSRMIGRLQEEGSVLNYQVNLRRKNGEELVASFDARGSFDTDGKLIYFDTIVQDITARVKTKRELERLARTDCLTGLLNRQHLMEKLENEMDRASRYRRPLSIMIFDLDHFKDVNDNHGHLMGDRVLIDLAQCIRKTLRKSDFAGRYGGEEFLAVLPETGLEGAVELAERLRHTVEVDEHPLPDGGTLRITCSIGVSQASSSDPEELIAAADAALYLAKRSGRNMVKIAGEIPED